MSPVYWFRDTDIKFCADVAQKRQNTNVKNAIDSIRYSNKSDLDCHLIGVAGEFAFCKMFRLPITHLENTESRSSKTEKDFDSVYQGQTIDVKTVLYQSHVTEMYVLSGKAKNPPDLYALVELSGFEPKDVWEGTQSSCTAKLLGFQWALKHVLHYSNLGKNRNGIDCYVYPVKQLVQFSDLPPKPEKSPKKRKASSDEDDGFF